MVSDDMRSRVQLVKETRRKVTFCQNSTMANFWFGERRRLGKALPQHKLMQNLLLSDFRTQKITKGTQTEGRKAASEIGCCCQRKMRKSNEGKSSSKVAEKRRVDEGYQRLLASIRDRVVKASQEEFCSCSDTWSDTSTDAPPEVNLPKETRNAMSLLLLTEKKPVSKFTKPCAWPGFAERTNSNSSIKIKRQLSK
ncbi:uncharacterized protein LOC103314108 [Tribolium castaneum]